MVPNTNLNLQKPVMLFDGQRSLSINIEEIVYLKAERVHCEMHMDDRKTIHKLSYNLSHIEATLPSGIFVRIQRSYIINIWKIRKIIGRRIYLNDTDEVFILGETYLHALDSKLIILGEMRD